MTLVLPSALTASLTCERVQPSALVTVTVSVPLDVYLRLCAALGVTPDYPVSGRFKLDHSALQRAIRDVFGDAIAHIKVTEDSVLSVGGGSKKSSEQEAMRVAGFLAAVIAGRYDVLCESDFNEPAQ